jgi:hypothetical protein
MPLSDLTFRLGDTGVVLNDDSLSFPFIDIDKVTGFDSAPFRETIRDHEGADGGFMDAEFETGREIILEGTVYCEIGTEETFLDSIKYNYAPSTVLIPFYLKAPGVNERVIFVKPRGVSYDWDILRRIGQTAIQFKMYAEDPRIYDNSLINVSIPYGGAATTGFGFASVYDQFNRNITDGLGTSDSGHTYTLSGGTNPGNYDVDGSQATISLDSINVARFATVNSASMVDTDITATITTPVTATGAEIIMGLVARFTDTNNYYRVTAAFDTTGNIDFDISKVVTSVTTLLQQSLNERTYSPNTQYKLHFQVIGNVLRANVWLATSTEPLGWQLNTTDSAITGSGASGIRTLLNTGNTNTQPVVVKYDNLQVLQGLGFNLDFGVTVPPDGTYVINNGNRPAPAILTITGPVTNPRVINDTYSKVLSFLIDLSALDVLTVDLVNRTVILNGTANRRGTMTTFDWFLFNPGSTFIRFGGDSGSGSLTVSYRNAWR